MEDKFLLSPAEAASVLGCSEQYIRRLLTDGKITGFRVGKSWAIPQETLEDVNLKKAIVMNAKDQKSKVKYKEHSGLKCLSFFSGAMGLDLGLHDSGIITLLACEIDKASRQTILTNNPDIGLIGDIRDFTANEILEYSGVRTASEIDLIVGGPPCQAFSTAGKRQSFEDSRGNVFLRFLDVIGSIMPKFVVIENVRGLLSSKLTIDLPEDEKEFLGDSMKGLPGSALMYIFNKLKALGYSVSFNLYNAANFGTPQVRERVVIICSRLGKVPYLTPTHSQNNEFGLPAWRTFFDAVSLAPLVGNDYVKFPEKRLKYLRMLKPGENWRNLPEEYQKEAMGKSYFLGGGKTGFYRRLAWNKPTPTLVTHPAMPATDLAHPEEDRPISVQEYKRVQEFPDHWHICGTIIDQYKQIGNAVPVGLGRAIGKAILEHLNGEEGMQDKNFQYSRYKHTSDVEFEREFKKALPPSKEKLLTLFEIEL